MTVKVSALTVTNIQRTECKTHEGKTWSDRWAEKGKFNIWDPFYIPSPHPQPSRLSYEKPNPVQPHLLFPEWPGDCSGHSLKLLGAERQSRTKYKSSKPSYHHVGRAGAGAAVAINIITGNFRPRTVCQPHVRSDGSDSSKQADSGRRTVPLLAPRPHLPLPAAGLSKEQP